MVLIEFAKSVAQNCVGWKESHMQRVHNLGATV